MNTVEVEVRAYPGTRVRSYHTKEGGLCKQDGFRFRAEKTPKEGYGVITFSEAIENRGSRVTRKVGLAGKKIIQRVAMSRYDTHLIDGCLVSAFQLNLEFDSVPKNEEIDKLAAAAIGYGLGVEVK